VTPAVLSGDDDCLRLDSKILKNGIDLTLKRKEVSNGERRVIFLSTTFHVLSLLLNAQEPSEFLERKLFYPLVSSVAH